MFWKKKNDTDKVAGSVDDAALDTLGSLLRTLGRYAFDLGDMDAASIHQACEGWARHVLIATPPPGGKEEGSAAAPDTQAERNWQGVREFVAQLRRQESAYVVSHFQDIRQVIGEFVQTVGKAFAEDQEDQVKIDAVLNQLRQVIEGNAPLDRLKEEALQAINGISQIAEARNQRHASLLEDLAGRLKSMRGELDEARREMELDPLTRLYNRKAFDQQLARVFELNKLSGQAACLMMVDADHFKRINDEYGHPAGDQVLRKFADCCVMVFPRKTDFVARYGGEEIAILLQDTPLDIARMLGNRMLQAIRALRVGYDKHVLTVTASMGIAEMNPKKNAADWLQRADEALYRAKQGGRDRIES